MSEISIQSEHIFTLFLLNFKQYFPKSIIVKVLLKTKKKSSCLRTRPRSIQASIDSLDRNMPGYCGYFPKAGCHLIGICDSNSNFIEHIVGVIMACWGSIALANYCTKLHYMDMVSWYMCTCDITGITVHYVPCGIIHWNT